METVLDSELGWSALNARQLGVSFRRQVVVGGLVADFCAPAASSSLKVDDGYHSRKPLADASRDLKLRRLGFRVVRISDELVLRDLAAAIAIALVRAAL